MKGLLAIAGLMSVGAMLAAGSSGSPRPRPLTGRVGRHWTWEELTVSSTARRLGLDNTPTPEAARNLEWMVANLLDPLREKYGRDAIRVTSGYRSPAVNRAVGGVPGSLHTRGLAVDIPSSAIDLGTSAVWKVIQYTGHVHCEPSARRLPYRYNAHDPSAL